jgi:hypothetical protein
VGDEADWIIDQILFGGYYEDGEGDDGPCGCNTCRGRQRHPPPRPETMSMFDNLDDKGNGNGKRRHPQRVSRSTAR